MRWWGIPFLVCICGCEPSAVAPPPAAPATAAPTASALPDCPAVDEDPRIARRNQLALELAELRASQALLPSEATEMAPGSFRSKLQLALVALKTPSAESEPSMLAALRRKLAVFDSKLEAERAAGKGERHPDVTALTAAQDRVREEIEKQRATEQHETQKLLSKLTSDEPRVAIDALVGRYDDSGFTLDRVASFDPIALRLDALQAMHLDIDRAELGARGYGPSHPRFVALDASRRALERQFNGDRAAYRAHAQLLKVLLSHGDQKVAGEVNAFSSRGDRRADRAREVADEIALLSVQLVQSPVQHAPVGSCVQRETKPRAY
ncbi:MAG: hypothetical protein KC766_28625 [Myxococcales bacterium]|nr:hypothetical protein [Myxococcales bacterium]